MYHLVPKQGLDRVCRGLVASETGAERRSTHASVAAHVHVHKRMSKAPGRKQLKQLHVSLSEEAGETVKHVPLQDLSHALRRPDEREPGLSTKGQAADHASV